MAFGNGTIWEVNSSGSDTANGGGFDIGATFATDLAATVATGTAPVVTSASYNFISRDVNAWLFVKSGTNWTPGWYQIASVAANAATLTATIGSAILFTNGSPSAISTAAGCATTASPTSGTWSIDYSRGTTAGITFTDMVIDGTTNTKFTSAGFPVGPHMIGNIIVVTAGTGFTTQRVEINSVSGTTATCDKSLGTLSSTGGNGGLGGCLASPGKAVGLRVAGVNTIFVLAGTYSLSTSSNASGGEMSDSGGLFIGYNTTRTITNTDTTRPLFNASTNSRTLYQTAAPAIVANIDFNANAKTGCTAFTQGTGYNIRAIRCTATGAFAVGFNTTWHGGTFLDCYTTGCTTGFALGGNYGNHAVGCIANSGATGFQLINLGSSCMDCIAANNSGVGFSVGSGCAGGVLLNCSAYNNTTGNFAISTGDATIRNCIAYTTAASYNYLVSTTNLYVPILNCAGGGAATGNVSVDGSCIVVGFIALSANPFTSVSTDFSLNNTAGGGAACRSAGIPGAFVGLTTTIGYPDLGAVQHSDPTQGYPTRARVFTGM